MKIAMGIWLVTWFTVWQISVNLIEIHPAYTLLIGYVAGLVASHFIRQKR